MYSKLIHFVKYNNAFNIIFVIFFFGFGISFAASEDVRESVYSAQETVVSVDNTRIVSADLDNHNFNLRINSVIEDEKNYYAAYSYQTIIAENSIWQDKEIEKVLTISKEALGARDLGLYIAKELGENINYELSYLKRTQKLEREKGESQKIVTVEYSGLIGKLLDPKEMVIEGYEPVIPEPVPEVPATVEENPEMVIVSVKHDEPPAPEEQPPVETNKGQIPDPVSEPETTTSVPDPAEDPEPVTPIPPETAKPPASEPIVETPTASSTEEIQQEQETVPPAEELIDETLVQEVVSALLENNTAAPEEESLAPEIPPEAELSAPQAE